MLIVLGCIGVYLQKAEKKELSFQVSLYRHGNKYNYNDKTHMHLGRQNSKRATPWCIHPI